MLSAFFSALFSFFLVDPIEAQLRERLAVLKAPAPIIEQATACVRDSAPKLLQQAINDPVWAVSSAVRVSIGWTTPIAVVTEAYPDCSAPLALLTANGDNT